MESIQRLLEESGATAHLSNAAVCDIKNIMKMLLRYASHRGCADKVSPEYCMKIAIGILGNWEWQLKNIRDGKQSGELKKRNSAGLWTP